MEMPKTNKQRVNRLGGMFGGLLGGAVKSLQGRTKPKGQKTKRKKTRKEILDSIMNQ